jgi:hypothetical protein
MSDDAPPASIYVYTDYRENVTNLRLRTEGLVTVAAVVCAKDILEADRQAAAEIGRDPRACPWVGCAPMSVDAFLARHKDQTNERNRQIKALRESIHALNYRIHGLENPWLLPEPDYSI